MSNIWFTSDTHFHHKNIVAGTSDWSDKSRCRNFETLEEHDEMLIKNINSVCMPNDTIYHLGDWSFGGIEQIFNFRERLICNNIHLILGNHDQHIQNNIRFGKLSAFDLFSSINFYSELKLAKKHFILCHFAFRVWNKSHHGSIHLYGHSHGTLDVLRPEFTEPTWIGDNYFIKNYKCMDVGVDTHPGFKPYNLDQIIRIMENKDVLLNIDHHNEKTN